MAFFSVIMATRNRPVLFRRALESVLAQSRADFEVIVVNDGSAVAHQSAYASILDGIAGFPVRRFTLVQHSNGHGQSYAINFGAAQANAPYLAFLDDDDCWTDSAHLGRARDVLAATSTPVDLYMTDQAAFRAGQRQEGPIWLEDLPPILAKRDIAPDRQGAHAVTVADLLQSRGFCHLNTLIVRRALFEEVGGMDETIRWECDRDLYLRLIDRATAMKYVPVTVARHNIPDPAEGASMTTALSEIERRLFQARVFDRAAVFARHPAIRAHGRLHKAYALKRIAVALAAAGRHAEAAFYAREALGAGPTIKWAGYTLWRLLRVLGSPARSDSVVSK